MIKFLVYGFMVAMFTACNPNTKSKISETETTRLMRTEFMESCRARPEYTVQKRAGTLDKICTCIFNKTMNGLSEEEQITAGFYLYGETHATFKARMKTKPFNADTIMIAAESVGKAAKVCH